MSVETFPTYRTLVARAAQLRGTGKGDQFKHTEECAQALINNVSFRVGYYNGALKHYVAGRAYDKRVFQNKLHWATLTEVNQH